MSIWNYPDQSPQPHEFADLKECPFCSTPLQRLFWDQRQSKSHNQNFDDLEGFVCQTCGWWKVIRETGIWGPYSQSRHMSKFAYQKFCQAGSLKNLYPGDLTLPLNELESVIWAYHTGGFARALSEVEIVASAFTSQEYEILVTCTSNDGGMIAILTKGAESIGVLVQHRENAIVVEQILAVTGALVREGNTRGVFVKTSHSQTGEDSTARLSQAKGGPIELVDALRLYAALGLVQIPPYSSQIEFLRAHSLSGLVRVRASDGF